MDDKIFITNIQRFSVHDGPGIRTTVFLKGCSLRCPWCSNPENMLDLPQPYIKNGVEGIYGEFYAPEQLYTEVIKDKMFYEGSNECGGVTFSGGECLLQMNRLKPLLLRLNIENIHMAVETCLFVPPEQLDIALLYINLFYVDIKILEEQRCRDVVHGNLSLYLSNLDKLLSSNRPIVFRIPVIGGFTDDVENRTKVINLVKKSIMDGNVKKVEIIKEHNLGKNKWQSLVDCNEGYKVPEYLGVSDELIEKYYREMNKAVNIPVEICKI